MTAATPARWHRLTERFRRDDDWLPKRTHDGRVPGRTRRVVRKVAALIGWALLILVTGLGLAALIVGAVMAVIVTINGSLP